MLLGTHTNFHWSADMTKRHEFEYAAIAASIIATVVSWSYLLILVTDRFRDYTVV